MKETDDSGWLWSRWSPDGSYVWWRQCPACGYVGDVFGDLGVDGCWSPSRGDCDHLEGTVGIGLAKSFFRPFCGLVLTHGEELNAAGIELIAP
ncbi:hypothetical protein [Streptomyces genisteinicus]|uniref:Uncharacterized protein n=1 Tax=Streptomyces genisteinicus TaxID=2768068 RepID=A0A7H0HRL7_9ACTN|nr:hypothetical protein [Streptomyces genisteinicus]QNP63183.1 hypothetical protein IAG43_09700 [Streptomyces genisteinicus]